MDEEIERLVVSVRADTAAFAGDVAEMRGQIEGPLAGGVERAGRSIENALSRAIRTGKLGFDDLKRVALSVMAEIAASAISSGIGSIGGGGGGGGGLLSAAATLLTTVLGAPGRATGGPVGPGRAYMVGERGPELFVPTASGRVEATGGGGARDVRVSITINAPAGSEGQALARSGRQMARAVRSALEAAER
jgi:phage-related minor tail protein